MGLWLGPIGHNAMGIIAPFIPMKIENSTCEIAFAALGTLFLCCVRVVYQNTRALLLLLFCYFYATWHVPVTHLTTYTQHEKRQAKEKWQDWRILQNRTYALDSNQYWSISSWRKLNWFLATTYSRVPNRPHGGKKLHGWKITAQQ